jgi:glycerate kinase
MKIVIAPDSFKGSLTAGEAADAIERGVLAVIPDAEIEKIPMADGGEGTMQALVTSAKGSIKEVETTGPLGRLINAQYGIIDNGKTAVIEMSAASGLLLLKENERNPLYTTTYGTGRLILDAIDSGCRNLIIGIGGSATNDGGAGTAQALGVRFFRKDKTEIQDHMCGILLGDVATITVNHLHPAIHSCHIQIASDVTNTLLGENGCAYVYARQKGATPEIIRKLEDNMVSFIEIAEKITCRSVRNIPGAGAAGGLGAGLMLFSDAQIQPGIDIVMDACAFSERIKDADLILTGEGKIDKQTTFGKTIAGIARRAKVNKIPVIAFAGIVENADDLYQLGVTGCFPIHRESMTIEAAMSDAAFLLQNTVERVIQDYMGSGLTDKNSGTGI